MLFQRLTEEQSIVSKTSGYIYFNGSRTVENLDDESIGRWRAGDARR